MYSNNFAPMVAQKQRLWKLSLVLRMAAKVVYIMAKLACKGLPFASGQC